MEFGQESVIAIAVAQPVWLLVAYLIGQLARRLLRGRVRLGTSSTTVIAVLGMSGGMLIAGLLNREAHPWSWEVVLLAIAVTTALLALFAAIAARLQPPRPAEPLDELIRRGESDRLEFKSSARWNLHTKARDERIELVIAKAVSGFLNSDGGTLLIGVNDAGELVGLANDFTVVRSPDPDRFELWLRDFLATTLGQTAAVQAVVDFNPITVDGVDTYVCRVACPASPRPVYLRPGKGGAQPELWVRIGNSTRKMKVDEAVDYVMHRWPLGMGGTVAAQLRAAARGSGTSG
ncbi:MAG TPA: ATP-binding protein [Nakamurella sp.]